MTMNEVSMRNSKKQIGKDEVYGKVNKMVNWPLAIQLLCH